MTKQLTFRDFAAAAMTRNATRAAEVLEALLELPGHDAKTAADYFNAQMASQGQGFMMKAMGLRGAVNDGTDADIGKLLGELFGLEGDVVHGAVASLRKRYS